MNRVASCALALACISLAALAPRISAASPRDVGFFEPQEAGLLSMVNQAVNRSHAAGSALPSDPDGVWDCDNYALKKFRVLRDDFHWSGNRLALGVARLPDRSSHMVLLVRGEAGWAILDNLTDDIVPVTLRAHHGWQIRFAEVAPAASPAAAWVLEESPAPYRFRS